jgi:hypothetical protein
VFQVATASGAARAALEHQQTLGVGLVVHQRQVVAQFGRSAKAALACLETAGRPSAA